MFLFVELDLSLNDQVEKISTPPSTFRRLYFYEYSKKL